ncbi:Riboflavin synthase alpha chain [Desulfamplus magnetovallimortis]|uniref:Riboflavin synthase n=1 Tax=Desulfamplus magnetovallimortis TaxID=1246637 RepID=A0A1W1H9Z2_9BACT|nr:riboflavin synthase [Desulfamplus magnetovallimortis]SLM29291.1 Riboflavin synthase alpha chain [Desulfamplus magnetovallimortis]
MFTGIIEGAGTLRTVHQSGEGKRLSIDTDMDLAGTRVGDSIAVNGACLTAVTIAKHSFSVDVAPETVSKTTFKKLQSGARLNLERALRLSDRIDGHLVSGHIDGTGKIISKVRHSNAVIVVIEVQPSIAAEMITKGSVAVDGISLTINRCSETEFEVSVIPHTADITTIGMKSVGDEVNIETDMLGKYVRKFLDHGRNSASEDISSKKDISMELLARKGFI